MRKWKELDAQGLLEDDEIDRQHVMATQIVDIADEIMREEAEKIDFEDPYTSVGKLAEGRVGAIDPEFRVGVINMVKATVVEHLSASIFVEQRHLDFETVRDKLREEGVLNG